MPVGSRVAVLFSAALVFAGTVLGARSAAAQATVSVACGSVGAEFDLCKTGAEAWAKKTGNQIKVVSVPKDSNDQLALFHQLHSHKSCEIYGIVSQGRAYEGLTCNALEWVDSFGGGTIVDGQGKVTINNPKAIAAIKLADSWIKNIAPEGVLNYAEEEARGAFQSGNAVFMRNWPYAWALSQAPDS